MGVAFALASSNSRVSSESQASGSLPLGVLRLYKRPKKNTKNKEGRNAIHKSSRPPSWVLERKGLPSLNGQTGRREASSQHYR
jgi:hypothetical protein